MEKVNIVFDGAFDDVDIIVIPNEISDNIEKIGQEFLDWVPDAEDSDYWQNKNGIRLCVAETDGFIKWLNSFYCTGIKQAYVLERNTQYNPSFKCISF